LKNARLEVDAQIVLAYSALTQHRVPATQEALSRASELSTEAASPNQWLALATCLARVNFALGKSASALQALQSSHSVLSAKATLQMRMEARFAVAEMTLAFFGSAAKRPLEWPTQ